MPRLDGKVAVITGVANGIGRAAAERFAAEAAKLILVDLDTSALASLSGPDVHVISADVSCPTAWCSSGVTGQL